MSNVKRLLYYNTPLWLPYDQQTYEFIKLYAEMAELAANEISVWGATYAQKPLYVTVRNAKRLRL